MKKLLLVLVVLSSCTLAFAQGEVGKWSVHVQLGVNMNNWGVKNSSGNMTFDWTDAIANIDRVETKSKLGLVGGAEMGYQMNSWFRPSVGLLFQSKGIKVKGYVSVPSHKIYDVESENKGTLGYLTLPLMANFYVVKGLALKVGIQPALRISCDHDMDDEIKPTEFSIPIGFSYEYANVILDARYYYGLTNPVKKLYSNTYLETKSLYRENNNSDNNKIGKEKLPIFENTSEKDKNLGNPFLNLETMNEVIELNGNDNKNNNRYEEISQYSFRCLTNNLNYKIKKGTKEIIIDLEYENNGKLAWPENETFLLIDETKSAFIIQKICLYPLRPGEKYLSFIHLNNLDKFKQGLYINYFIFNVKGKDFGNNIKFTIEIY